VTGPICEVIITADSEDWLINFTRSLVEDRLAACGQHLAPIRSVYRWDGTIHDDREFRVALHTRTGLEHPYEVPCVLALSIQAGNPDYVRWVLEATHDPGDDHRA
jgi:periplasmic divalent cation tolerance protein